MKVIATKAWPEIGTWELRHLPEMSSNMWQTLQLIRPPEARQRGDKKHRKFHFGWNGQRLSKNGDTAQIAKRWPKVLAWVCLVMIEKTALKELG